MESGPVGLHGVNAVSPVGFLKPQPYGFCTRIREGTEPESKQTQKALCFPPCNSKPILVSKSPHYMQVFFTSKVYWYVNVG